MNKCRDCQNIVSRKNDLLCVECQKKGFKEWSKIADQLHKDGFSCLSGITFLRENQFSKSDGKVGKRNDY